MRDLLVEHPWDAVSVRSICERADVSRSAFYAHCADKDQALDLAFEALRQVLDRRETSRGLDRNGTFAFLPALVERNRSTAAQVAIYRRFKVVVEELAAEELSASDYLEPDDHVFAFTIGGMFAVLEQWCERDCLVLNE